jgi:two-component system response regulator NreC
VLIVHNVPLIRFGLARLIEADGQLVTCGKTGDAPTARELFVRQHAQLVILGLTLSGGDGFELLKDFRKMNPRVQSIVFSSRTDRSSIERVFGAGARGYLLASEGTAEVLHAVRHVCAVHFYASRIALQQIVEGGAFELRPPSPRALSDRELQVLSLIGRGFGASRLAHELHLSVKTIETHQMHLKQKLGLQSAAELAKAASEWMVNSAQRHLDLVAHANRRRASLLGPC